MRRVGDLGVEHGAVEAALVVGDDGEGRALAARHGAEAGGKAGDPVAVAHPDLLARAGRPDVLGYGALAGDIDEGAAEFAVLRGFDRAAELGRECLLAVADA